MSRSRSVSPVGQGRFDAPFVPPSKASSMANTSPTTDAHHFESMNSSPTSSHAAPYRSDGSSDDAGASTATAPSSVASADHSCGYDADDWFARFRDDIDVSDDIPSSKTLGQAGSVPIYDAHGKARPFSTLYSEGEAIGERQLVLFIRHFYCGACQAYLQELTKSITMQTYFSMPIPTSIVVIGCGSPVMIAQYKAITQCPFPIFADPTRQLYKTLGMGISFQFGHVPEYMNGKGMVAWQVGQLKQVARTQRSQRFKCGNWLQIGGEFLFEGGEVVWCHRMKNYRGHAEMKVLRRLLQIDNPE